jgi:uncharacterized protein (TIGR03382 family)
MNKLLLASTLSASLLGCAAEEPTYGTNQGDSFEVWKSKLGREPGTGKYILDWDIVIGDEDRLYEHWQAYQQGALSIYRLNGTDIKWSDTQKINLTYCIGATFGANKQLVINAMEAATTNGWEKFANINFVHLAAQDANCTAANTNVVFDVNQVNSGGQYLARAFFPNDARADRNVLIDPASFNLQSTGNIPLANIVIHELGHTLGFRHEHIRSDQGRTVQCPEDANYRGVTDYDVVSTMHYPQCGSPNNTLALSAKDQTGVASVYGPPGGNAAPVAQVLSPTNGSTVGPNFDLEAMVVDTNIQKVELVIDGAIVGAPLNAPPYIFMVTNLSVGMHNLKVKATDAGGLVTDAVDVTVTVAANGGTNPNDPNNPNNPGGNEPASNDISGGCSTGGSTSIFLAFGLLGLVLRRRR